MLLKIENHNNRYFIKGDLNYNTLQEFEKTFLSVFKDYDEITIDIDGLKSIDRHGVNAIARLHNEAVLSGKLLTIIGHSGSQLNPQPENTDAA